MLLVECVIFSLTGNNFLSATNAFEVTRLSVEIGLLALVLTPVIISGGIDLSVGSMMGLAAVVMGGLWRDAGLPIAVAAAIAVIVGALGGSLNALMIARLKFPPLIVTLGTFSLFRGIAEGLTRGIENYSGFSSEFLFLGQGHLFGVIPTQLLVLVAAIAAFGWMLHRASFGRALYAIGHSAEGARYAGIRVERHVAVIYVLSGIAASLAAIVYVAHLGQAKSDAGTGYELMAITAVVLGGASIFGGRGTILGTVLGLFAIVILQNGLRLSAQPSELAGILMGVLLVGTILLDRLSKRSRAISVGGSTGESSLEEDEVRNSQVAVLSGVILAGALIVAGSNWLLVRSLRTRVANDPLAQPPAANDRKTVIAMMPKAKGDPYFISCKLGAEEAAKELGVELLWDGPTDLDPAKQNEVVEAWITRGVDAIAVSVENKEGISTVLRKAREQGNKGHYLGRRRRERRARFPDQSGNTSGHWLHAHRRGRENSERQRRICDRHCLVERGESKRVDQVHQRAFGPEVSGSQAGGNSAERGRPRPRFFRDANAAEGLSECEVDHGHCGAGGARRCRSR